TAALLALKSLAPGCAVTLLDPSLGMLRVARRNGLDLLVSGSVPGIPFPDGTFDTVMASFVLSHVRCYRAALLDMVRVLRPAGRLGLTAWGCIESEWRRLWQETADSFVPMEQLEPELRSHVPWESWFSDKRIFEDAVREAGLTNMEIRHVEYKSTVSVGEFL